MHSAEVLVPKSQSFMVEIAIEKLRRCESLVLMKFWQNRFIHYILRSTNILILFVLKNKYHSCGKKL